MSRPALAFLTILAFSFAAHAEAPKSQSLRDFVAKNKTRHAVGLYLQGKKVGYMILELDLGEYKGEEVAIETSEMLLSLTVMDEKSVMQQKERVIYSLQGEGPIISAEQRTTHDRQETVLTAERTEKGMAITTTIGGNINRREIPQPKATVAQSQRIMNWMLSGPKKGDKFEYWGTEWDEAEVDSKEVFIFQSKKSINWGGVPTDVFQMKINLKGAIFDAEVLANGNPIRGKVGGLLELRAESEEFARKIDEGAVDMIAASSIKVDRDLGLSSQICGLKLEVVGLGEFTLPESHRQKLSRSEGKTYLELKEDFRIEKAEPLSDAERKTFTSATPSIQCDHEKVTKLAQEIVGDETDPLKKANKIKSWVYRKLRKTMASNSLTALGVLNTMAGDCTEHTLLFVSLCRAAGIPAREVTGVAHIDSIFGWHAWAEIHDGHQWVSVDPTWNELYVDATHVVFSRDPKDHAWLNVLGNVSFKTVTVERKK